MRSLTVLLVCLYFLVFLSEAFGSPGLSGGGRSGFFSGGRSSSTKGTLGTPKNNAKQPVGSNIAPGGATTGSGSAKAAKTGGMFLSAWGIISLILFVIVGSALTYYISIFYPLVCAKRGKYDVMEMTTV